MNESFPGIPLLQDYEVVNEPFLAKLQLKVSTSHISWTNSVLPDVQWSAVLLCEHIHV
jgi:hypothetical protein